MNAMPLEIVHHISTFVRDQEKAMMKCVSKAMRDGVGKVKKGPYKIGYHDIMYSCVSATDHSKVFVRMLERIAKGIYFVEPIAPIITVDHERGVKLLKPDFDAPSTGRFALAKDEFGTLAYGAHRYLLWKQKDVVRKL